MGSENWGQTGSEEGVGQASRVYSMCEALDYSFDCRVLMPSWMGLVASQLGKVENSSFRLPCRRRDENHETDSNTRD